MSINRSPAGGHLRKFHQESRTVIARADLIEGVVKGMAVLESFDTERQRLNATLAAQRAGITRAAARRHLLTLAHLGYLETDGSQFWLSSKVLGFSGSYLASARLPRTLQPLLERLSAQSGEQFSAVVLNRDEVVIVARNSETRRSTTSIASAGQVLPYGLHLGARLPAHATSTGRVLLAALPAAQWRAWIKGRVLPRLTVHTVTEPRALQTIIAQVRRDDYCLSVEEHELGVQALAVPLRDARGHTVAALNVVVDPMRRDASAILRDLLPLLWDAAREARTAL